jgi:hypothetical protein
LLSFLPWSANTEKSNVKLIIESKGDPVAKTMAQVKNERLKYLREFRPILRKVDAAIEDAQRELERIIKRKRAYPEPGDLLRLSTLLKDIASNLSTATTYIGRGYAE